MFYPCSGFASLTVLFLSILAFLQICPGAGHVTNKLGLIDDSTSTFINPGQIDKVLTLWNLSTVAGNYSIVAVAGSQSSGKSTTLNKLFQTEFEMMDPSVMKQTTIGIWMAPVQGTNIIVLDAEGSDSKERQENTTYEQKTLSFTLAHANVLMINIWKQLLPTFKGAGFPLFQAIFERNLHLFPHRENTKKVLLFLILNDDGRTPFDQLKDIIRTNIEHIWGNIHHNGLSPYDYFVLEFHSIPPENLLSQNLLNLSKF